jgi:hypothetical protein
VKSWARAAENRVRKLLRRPGKTIDLQVHDVIQMQESAVVDLTQAWGPPPDPTIDLPAYADVVTRRINHLHEKVQTQQHDLAAEVEARGTAIRQAQNALTAEVDEVRKLSRQVAVGGLRLQVVGWLFLLAGIVVGTIANIVGS